MNLMQETDELFKNEQGDMNGEPEKEVVQTEASQEEAVQTEDILKETEPTEDVSRETTQAEDNPGEDARAEDNPGEDAQAEDNPGEDAQAEDNPKEDTQAEDNPKEDAQAEDNPKEDTQAEDNPKEDAMAENSPKEDALAEDNPKEDTLAEDNPKETAQKEDTWAEGDSGEDTSEGYIQTESANEHQEQSPEDSVLTECTPVVSGAEKSETDQVASFLKEKASLLKEKASLLKEKTSLLKEKASVLKDKASLLKKNLPLLTEKITPAHVAGAAIGVLALMMAAAGAVHRQTNAENEVQVQETEANPQMAVVSADYTPSMRISAEGMAYHTDYETMLSDLNGWVSEFGRINIREDASTDSRVLGQLVYGDAVTTYEEKGDFTRIRYIDSVSGEEMEGYFYTAYLSKTAPDTAPVYLNVPLLKQADSRWGAVKIGNYETLASAGCTTTCIAMAETYMTGEEVYPDDVAKTLPYTYDGKLTFPDRYDRYFGSDYLAVVLKKLHEGVPCLVSGYTSDGRTHWVVVVGYEGDGIDLQPADFAINDPGSYRYTLEDFFDSYPLFEKIVYYTE